MESKEKTKQHFNETAADYNNSNDGKFVTPMYESLLKEIHKSQTGRILDVGCGNGNLFSFLSNEQYELFGIDFSENMIAEAKKSFSEKASFFVADAEELPFADNTIDIITCNASFHHYVHPNTVLAEMKRILKDGGKLLIGDPYPPFVIRPIMNLLTKYSDKGDYHFYGIAEMKKLLVNNGLEWNSSIKTGRFTILHIAKQSV